VKRKVVRTTITVRALIITVWGYVYAVMGGWWPPFAAGYETRRDYRLVFRAYS
jgi:hypothetical protein